VFSIFFDVDKIDSIVNSVRLLSRNRPNAISFYDRDYGQTDGTPVHQHARNILRQAGLGAADFKIFLLCHPRIFGYVFNPLSVYFCFSKSGALGALIYEVSNTFGERASYVLRAGEPENYVYSQSCSKAFFVSPFNGMDGQYRFRVKIPTDTLMTSVDLYEKSRPLLVTRYVATAKPLTDRSLVCLLLRYPLMTIKIFTAIHIEALKLWMKGVPLHRRPPPRNRSIIFPASGDGQQS